MAQSITAAQPAAPRDGLAGVVGLGVIVPDTDPIRNSDRWGVNTFQLEGLGCGRGYTADVSCAEPGNADRAGTSRRRFQTGDPYRPFTIGAGVECSTFGSQVDLAVWNAEARADLERIRWSQIAAELWSGAKGDHQHLASDAATVLSEDPVSPVEAVGALEDAMGGCVIGQPDLIHVPRKATAYLSAAGLLTTPTPTSGRLQTYNGSLVVADRAYPGTGPAGQEPTGTTVWAYATSVITARLGAVVDKAQELNEAVDAESNNVEVRAEQLVAIGWLCCHYAIPIRLSC